MGRYLITGSPGAGKSTVARAMKRRGLQAYDSEEMPSITKLEEKRTGLPVPWPKPPVDWEVYAFNWQDRGLRRLLSRPGDVFVAAAVSNQDAFYHLFDKIFVLTIDPSTLDHRLATRTKRFGKLAEERAGILNGHANREANYLSQPQAVAIDARQPLQHIIEAILRYVQNDSR